MSAVEWGSRRIGSSRKGPKAKECKLYLDDVRQAPEGWQRVYTAQQCIRWLNRNKGKVTHLSLDHDLGLAGQGVIWTGQTVMNWIEREVNKDPSYPLPEITFHTANPVGKKNMEATYQAILRAKGNEEPS